MHGHMILNVCDSGFCANTQEITSVDHLKISHNSVCSLNPGYDWILLYWNLASFRPNIFRIIFFPGRYSGAGLAQAV
jgi:hypothetical protein